jgi:hypothetical protein
MPASIEGLAGDLAGEAAGTWREVDEHEVVVGAAGDDAVAGRVIAAARAGRSSTTWAL